MKKFIVSIASLLLPAEFQRGKYLIEEYMFGWVIFNFKHQFTNECQVINDTLVSVTGFNWINSLSCGKDTGIVKMK